MSSTVASKPSTGRKAKTTAAAPAVAPVVAAPAPAPVAAPVVAAAPAHVEEPVNIVAEFATAVEEVNTLRTQLATVFSKMKKLEKQIPRELKKAQKGGRRARKVVDPDAPKKETIFTKPTPISDALCGFLGIAKGSQVSRSEVTSRVCKYAKDKGLMEKQNIKADAALRKLLSLKESDELKILNLQRYLKSHYIKPAVTA
jgi:chromatin remodeling complex protein RSC6